jgi:hypothetical protein
MLRYSILVTYKKRRSNAIARVAPKVLNLLIEPECFKKAPSAPTPLLEAELVFGHLYL